MQAARLPIKRASRPHSTLLYLKLHSSVLRLSLFGGVVGDGLVGAVAFGDDVVGRAKTYESIVKGEQMPVPGIPESLNVLLHELRGLCLKINLE